MDDVQFVSGKEKTQEELFHLFNVLYDNNKQIIFTSDKHPGYLQNIEERLKSRFKQGMVVDISDPDFESRLAIIMTKAAANNFTLTPEIAEYLARSIDGNIRELEGALNAVMLQSQIHDRTLTIADVRNLIKDSGKTKKTISTKEIVKKVAEFYNIEEQIIYDKTRKKEVVRPRQIIMFILREDFRESFPSIGEKLGGRDHTTVIHSCEKIREDIQTDSLLLQEINQIRAMLK
jgi:chromosomal replication initiator protein